MLFFPWVNWLSWLQSIRPQKLNKWGSHEGAKTLRKHIAKNQNRTQTRDLPVLAAWETLK